MGCGEGELCVLTNDHNLTAKSVSLVRHKQSSGNLSKFSSFRFSKTWVYCILPLLSVPAFDMGDMGRSPGLHRGASCIKKKKRLLAPLLP